MGSQRLAASGVLLRASIFLGCALTSADAWGGPTNPRVGVNVVDVDQLADAQQDALVEQLQRDGVRVVRLGLDTPGLTSFVRKAFKRGIETVAILQPARGSTSARMRPVDPAAGLTWRVAMLSEVDPAAFAAGFAPELAALEADGVHFAAFEVGNEINTAGFNGDFPLQAAGRVLGVSDLDNPKDAEAQTIARGLRVYLKVLGQVKRLRDSSRLDKTTPILSAGLASVGLPTPRSSSKQDAVSAPGTLEFLRQNGLDALVDGYGVHVYPSVDPSRTVAQRVDPLEKDTLSQCGPRTKPCWLTEWGFTTAGQACPLDDTDRVKMISTMRTVFSSFASQGRLAAALYYSWSGHPGVHESREAIFRCGELTAAGRLALQGF